MCGPSAQAVQTSIRINQLQVIGRLGGEQRLHTYFWVLGKVRWNLTMFVLFLERLQLKPMVHPFIGTVEKHKGQDALTLSF